MAAGTDAEKREARQQIVSFENQPKKHQSRGLAIRGFIV